MATIITAIMTTVIHDITVATVITAIITGGIIVANKKALASARAFFMLVNVSQKNSAKILSRFWRASSTQRVFSERRIRLVVSSVGYTV